MKILVVSDTHGRAEPLKTVIHAVKPFDYLFHAGDVEGMEDEIRREASVPCVFARGNNDYFSNLKLWEVFSAGGYRFLITHGHRMGVHGSAEALRAKAKELRCGVAVFGHTHFPLLDESDPELTLLNPGSLSFPRQPGREPSYAIIEIDRFGKIHYTINYLSREPKKMLWL